MEHDATGIVTPSQHYENHDSIFITSSLSIALLTTMLSGIKSSIFLKLPYIITLDTHLADLKSHIPEQIKHIQPLDPAFFILQQEESTNIYLNELLEVPQPNESRKHTCLLTLKNQVTQLHAFQFNKGFTTHFSNSKNSKN